MSSLKEKAKTSYSICENAYLTCEVCEPQNKCGSGNCPLYVRRCSFLEEKFEELLKEAKP
jgi:hypothetical protein